MLKYSKAYLLLTFALARVQVKGNQPICCLSDATYNLGRAHCQCIIPTSPLLIDKMLLVGALIIAAPCLSQCKTCRWNVCTQVCHFYRSNYGPRTCFIFRFSATPKANSPSDLQGYLTFIMSNDRYILAQSRRCLSIAN